MQASKMLYLKYIPTAKRKKEKQKKKKKKNERTKRESPKYNFEVQNFWSTYDKPFSFLKQIKQQEPRQKAIDHLSI